MHISEIFEFVKSKYKNIKLIGGYIPINYEYDCLNILKFYYKKKYAVALPVIKDNYKMDFYNHSFEDPLKINKLGIPEPYKLSKKIIPDLVFVPLVGYDDNFNRLGYGGGFYDRYFEKNLKLKKINNDFKNLKNIIKKFYNIKKKI